VAVAFPLLVVPSRYKAGSSPVAAVGGAGAPAYVFEACLRDLELVNASTTPWPHQILPVSANLRESLNSTGIAGTQQAEQAVANSTGTAEKHFSHTIRLQVSVYRNTLETIHRRTADLTVHAGSVAALAATHDAASAADSLDPSITASQPLGGRDAPPSARRRVSSRVSAGAVAEPNEESDADAASAAPGGRRGHRERPKRHKGGRSSGPLDKEQAAIRHHLQRGNADTGGGLATCFRGVVDWLDAEQMPLPLVVSMLIVLGFGVALWRRFSARKVAGSDSSQMGCFAEAVTLKLPCLTSTGATEPAWIHRDASSLPGPPPLFGKRECD